MSRGRRAPLVARNFQVRLVLRGARGGRAAERELAFSQVVFPSFRLDGRRARPITDLTPAGAAAEPQSVDHLVLRRGHTGSAELYDLWRAERDGDRRQVRDVTVVLLDEDFRPVSGWHFAGCHIVSLDYSPLDALDVDVFTESLELTFKSVDQIKL